MAALRSWPVAGFLSLVVFSTLSLCGCSDPDVPRGSVEGKVSFNGTAVEQGTISFIPTAGTKGPATYATIKDGHYVVGAADHGPVLGKHQVKIEAFRDMGKKHPQGGGPLLEQVIPDKFNKATTLVVEIAKGPNTQNFDLSSR